MRPSSHLQSFVVTGMLLASLFLFGCANTIEARPAPFRARPDSVEAGKLLGPFTGKVVDSANGSPIRGALVYAVWTLERGTGLSSPAGYHEVVASTDLAGGYQISALTELTKIPRGTRVTDVTIVIYKSGYVGYRSDRRFLDLGPRRDFAQERNNVRLDRWRADYSHARHVRFIGGGEAVAALTSWELDEAGAELTAGRPGNTLGRVGTGPYLVAAQLLNASDIIGVTKYNGQFENGPLGDEPDTSVYSSQHFKALGREPTWDIAVRVWRSEPDDAAQRYKELTGLPNVDVRDEIASQSFRTQEPGVRGLVFLDDVRGLVVMISCGESQCSTDEPLVAISRIINERIGALWVASVSTFPGTTPPPSTEPTP